MGINIGNPVTQIYTGSAVPGSTDPDAIAFVASASITNPPVQNAIYRLVYDLKSASLWDKISVAYPLVSNYGGAIPGGSPSVVNTRFLSSSILHPSISYIPPTYVPGTFTEGTRYIEERTTSSVTHSIASTFYDFKANTHYRIQADIHPGTLGRVKLEFDRSESIWGTDPVNAIFDLTNGTIYSSGSTTTASIQPLEQGWYRAGIIAKTSESVATTTGNGFILFVSGTDTTNYATQTQKLCFIENFTVTPGASLNTQNFFLTQGTVLTSSFAYNLKDPRPLTSSYFMTFGGTVNFSGYGIWSGPNRSGYGNSNFPLGLVHTTQSYHIGIYTRIANTSIDSNEFVIGVTTGSFTGQVIKYTVNAAWNGGPFIIARPTASFEVLTVTNNTASTYANGITLTAAQSPAHDYQLPNRTVGILMRNNPGEDGTFNRGDSSLIPLSFVSMGQGLTQNEVIAYNTIVERFQRALNRSMIL